MRGRRAGFSLVEMVVAMSLTLVVFAITLPFVRVQSRALGASAGRLDAEQIARYAQRAIDRELRLAQADPGQPLLVYAGPMAIAFTANLLAPDTTDPNALSVQPGAPASLTEAWLVAEAATLPLTSTSYPTQDHTDADGAPSRNETVMYFLHPDTVSDRSDIYVLHRRVNARDSVTLVRGIHVPADSAFFSYFRMQGGALTRIPAGELPLLWSATDIADIRAVGLRSAGWFRNRQEDEDVIRTVYWRTVLPNLRVAVRDCGAAPAAPTSVAQSQQPPSSPTHVQVTWNASTDDSGGEQDVTHYVLRLRSTSTADTMNVAVVPARGVASYRYEHYRAPMVGNVKYGVTAVDCAGQRSATVEHNSNLTLP